MKTLMKIQVLLLSSMLLSGAVMAQSAIDKIKQDEKYGKDEESRLTCAQNLSSMAEYVEVNALDLAYEPWLYCYINCPASRKNIYIMGAKIIKYKIENAANDEEKNAFIDTLMQMYDKRAKYNFCSQSEADGKKGIDLMKYRLDDLQIAYGYLQSSVENADPKKMDDAVPVYLLNASNALYQAGKIEGAQLVTDYMNAMKQLEAKIDATTKEFLKKRTRNAMEKVEKIFSESGAADCPTLINIFTPKYEADKDNLELMKKIRDLLSATGCDDSELYGIIAVGIYEKEPSASAAAALAKRFNTEGDAAKASEYFNKAIELEIDAEAKSGYYFELARLAMKDEDYPKVRSLALKAIENKADYGDAYILIGSAYVASKCGATPVQKGALYWVAVDKFQKAKIVDPSVAEKADNLIKQYKKYFPMREKVFMEISNYKEGMSYKVGCWINESTTVRTNTTKN